MANQKLQPFEVRAILKAWETRLESGKPKWGFQTALAKQYGVSQATINKIVHSVPK